VGAEQLLSEDRGRKLADYAIRLLLLSRLIIEPPLDMSDTADWTANSTPFRLVPIILSNCSSVHLAERGVVVDDGVGAHDACSVLSTDAVPGNN
jgi:hypothetical protein